MSRSTSAAGGSCRRRRPATSSRSRTCGRTGTSAPLAPAADYSGRVRAPGKLVDRFGRVATDLRVSLIDRCSLRCAYCMPPEGLDWLPKDTLLTDDEIVRLVRIAVSLGVTEVRLTGGEPLLRRGVPDL